MKSNIANILKLLTLPYGAAADKPRIVIGSDIPANIPHITAAILFYANNNAGDLIGFYIGVGPGTAVGASIELGFFPADIDDPSFTQVVTTYQFDFELSTQPIMVVNAFRTIFEGLGLNEEFAFFQDYNLAGDVNSEFDWKGPATFSDLTVNSLTVNGAMSYPVTRVVSTPTDMKGLAMGPGFTLNSGGFRYHKAGPLVTVWVYGNSTNAITATSGNIPDTTYCTLPTGIRPPVDTPAVYGNGSMDGEALIAPTGVVTLRSADGNIAAGSNIRFAATYVI
ncbi:hypothetical protein OG559_31085 (plasmid) [Micromonospora sp. NBC_01405]|uniref:hypothetical protein n=1 Tax=Micromonospora sp. NBC_01405 TaxID=2903589 RepID=UPI00324D6DB8